MKGICGLGNVGNSCYINAALQILTQIDELNHYLLRIKDLKSDPALQFVFEWVGLYQMIQENHCSIMPNRFIKAVKQVSRLKNRKEFTGNQQNDSIDYFEFMIDCIHTSLNHKDPSIVFKKTGCIAVDKYLKEVEERDSSIVQKLFLTFTLNQYIHPVTLKTEFYKIEHEYKIELSIPNQKKVSLHDCFLETFKDEPLAGENAWFDEKENRKKNVIKRSALAYIPEIMCLQLKRWNLDLSKKTTCVEAPLILDLNPFTIYKEESFYKLFGIMNHDGNIQGGHYYSYILRGEEWFSLNDHFIQSISTESIIHQSNYCLFYRKIK